MTPFRHFGLILGDGFAFSGQKKKHQTRKLFSLLSTTVVVVEDVDYVNYTTPTIM
jgi:hypothetical protein